MDINYVQDAKDEAKYFRNGKFLHNVFARDLIRNYNIIQLNNNQLFIYEDGIYENNSKTHKIETAMLDEIDSLKTYNIKEVMNYIRLKSEVKKEADEKYIAFLNCVLDIKELKEIPFTPDIILQSRINASYIKYDDNATNEVVDKFFEDITCNNKELIDFLYAIIGYSCYRSNDFQIAFVLKRKWSVMVKVDSSILLTHFLEIMQQTLLLIN